MLMSHEECVERLRAKVDAQDRYVRMLPGANVRRHSDKMKCPSGEHHEARATRPFTTAEQQLRRRRQSRPRAVAGVDRSYNRRQAH